MITKEIYEVGDRISFKKFCYTNKMGGTSRADLNPITDYDINLKDIVIGEIVHEFQDYECGQRLHVKLEDRFWKLIKDKAKENKVYVSEFAVITVL